MSRRNAELLAPAGSFESLVAAVNAGADAVYIGGSRFGARAYADNLDETAMVRAIQFAHLHGRRLYMTVNTLVKEGELAELFHFLRPYYEAGLDAVIVQDLGVFSFIRSHFPDLPVHVSTQMTVTGEYGARMLKEMGAVRVVPARELSLQEIRKIYETTGMEIETFVHGALCYCYSGQCLFSSLIGGRSGNRGRCAQTCRLPFEVKRDGKSLNKRDEKYVLSLKDLCALDILPDILESGVCSLKIEGRMKSPRYTAGVVSIYRKYLDRYLEKGRGGYLVEEGDRRALLDLFDRGGQSEGYYSRRNGRDMVVLKEKPAFREANQKLYDYLDKTFVTDGKKVEIGGEAWILPGEPLRLSVSCRIAKTGHGAPQETRDGDGGEYGEETVHAAVAGEPVQEAWNAPMTEDKIRRQLEKAGNSPFAFRELEIHMQGNVFAPVQALNKLRREALETLEQEIAGRHRRTVEILGSSMGAAQIGTGQTEAACSETVQRKAAQIETMQRKAAQIETGQRKAAQIETGQTEAAQIGKRDSAFGKQPELAMLVNTEEQLEAAVRTARSLGPSKDFRTATGKEGESLFSPFSIYLASEAFGPERWKPIVTVCHDAGVRCYLMLPRVFRAEAKEYFLSNRETLLEAGFDALGAASMEEPQFVREELRRQPELSRSPEISQAIGISAARLPLYFDHSLYAFNHLAAAALREMGADRITVPVELNRRETEDAGLCGELIVYGRLPMMVSAQCIKKTQEGCARKEEILYLKDRIGKEFPVVNQCRFCYNTIYNSSPLSLLGLSAEAKRLEPEALRLNFTVESGEETAAVIEAFYREYVLGEEAPAPFSDFTRGHFKRGVQ